MIILDSNLVSVSEEGWFLPPLQLDTQKEKGAASEKGEWELVQKLDEVGILNVLASRNEKVGVVNSLR